MKKYLGTALVSLFLTFSTTVVFAQAEYVLPYPSFMPGHPLYKASSLVDKLQEWWSFGNLAKFTYHLGMSDKYLVEAKTLLEYKQYLLGVQALSKSDSYFQKTKPYLEKAKQEGKDTRKKEELLQSVSRKHQEVLQHLVKIMPSHFLWQPERGPSTQLNLKEIIDNSMRLRVMD